VPQEYLGPVIQLCVEKRGTQKDLRFLGRQAMLSYEIPLNEVVIDFFDRLKSLSRGYASFDYEFHEFRPADLVRVDILINGDRVDALSVITHRTQSQYRGRELIRRLRELIPRQMFDVAIQAAIGGACHFARDSEGLAQERHGQVLWRGREPKTQASRTSKGRKET